MGIKSVRNGMEGKSQAGHCWQLQDISKERFKGHTAREQVELVMVKLWESGMRQREGVYL